MGKHFRVRTGRRGETVDIATQASSEIANPSVKIKVSASERQGEKKTLEMEGEPLVAFAIMN